MNELDWRGALHAAASLLIVRPLAIAVSLVGAGLRAPTVAFFGWFGPRGLASILFALAALAETGEVDLEPVFIVVSWTVLASIVAHGVSATPGAAAYGRWWQAMPDKADMAESIPMAEQRIRGGPMIAPGQPADPGSPARSRRRPGRRGATALGAPPLGLPTQAIDPRDERHARTRP